ncbi:MAG: hypothetical protein V4687_15190 [Bacteroidota bacterium]
MSAYKDEWIDLLLKQKLPGWLIANDKNHIFINVPEDQDLETAMEDFIARVKLLKPKVKAKPAKLSFFIGNSKDSKFYEL